MCAVPNLVASPPLGDIVYLGAGTGDDLEAWLRAGAQRIVLVEPNPGLVAGLEARAADLDRLEVLPLAIAGKTGQSHFHLFNAIAHSSLRQPTGLKDLFPGLRQTRELMVDTLSIDDLIARIGLSDTGNHALIIDAPGEEQAIVSALVETGLLRRFAHILLRGGIDPLYEGSAGLRDVLPLLTGADYTLQDQQAGDPDFLDAYLWQDPVRAQNAAFRQQIEALEKANEAAKAQALQAESALQARLAAAEQAEQEAAAARAALEARVDALQRELAEAGASHAAQQEAAATREGALEARVSALQQDLAEAETRLAQRAEDCTALEARAKKAEGAWQAVKTELEGHNDILARKEGDLSVALRSQAALQVDLQSLRDRFETLRAEKADQDELLLQVTSRLSAASDYLGMLSAPAAGSPALVPAAGADAAQAAPGKRKAAAKPRSGGKTGKARK